MKSITIHNLDDKLNSLIREKSRKDGISLNRTIKKLLAKALGIEIQKNKGNNEFNEFLCLWNEKEFNNFSNRIKEFQEIDKEEW